jgi:CheY-like chemotaxis protein
MTPAEATAVLSARTIVIVNGSPDMRDVLDVMLESGEYVVVIAQSTDDAYSLIRRIQPHLVLLGLRMDDVGGSQLLSMLKLDPATRQTRVLTCTLDEEAEPPSEEIVTAMEVALRPTPRLSMN